MKKIFCLFISAAMLFSAVFGEGTAQEEILREEILQSGGNSENEGYPKGGLLLEETFESGEPVSGFETGNAFKAKLSSAQTVKNVTEDLYMEGINVHNTEGHANDRRKEGPNTAIVFDYDIMFEDLFSKGVEAYTKIYDKTSSSGQSVAEIHFMGAKKTMEMKTSYNGNFETSKAYEGEMTDNRWYHIRHTVYVSDGNLNLNAKTSVNIDGIEAFSNLGWCSLSFDKFPNINSIGIGANVSGDQNVTVYMDNLSVYKINVNYPEAPYNYGAALGAIRGAESVLSGAKVGTAPEEYSPESCEELERLLNSAKEAYLSADKTPASVSAATEELKAALENFAPNGLPLLVENPTVEYFRSTGSSTSSLILAKGIRFKTDVKTSRYANDEKLCLIGLLTDGTDEDGDPVIKSIAATDEMVYGADISESLALSFSLEDYSRDEKERAWIIGMAWDSIKGAKPYIPSVNKYVEQYNGETLSGAKTSYETSFISKSNGSQKISFKVSANAGNEIVLKLYAPGATADDEITKDNISQKLLYVNQLTADKNGKAEFRFKIPDEVEDGTLDFEVINASSDEKTEGSIEYYKKQTLDGVLAEINGKSADKKGAFELLYNYRKGLDLDLPLLERAHSEGIVPEKALDVFFENVYTSDQHETYKILVENVLYMDMANGVSSRTLCEMMNKKGELSCAERLGLLALSGKKLERYNKFLSLSDDKKTYVADLIRAMRPFESESGFLAAFDEGLFTGRLNKLSNTAELETLIEESSDLLENASYFTSLSDYEKGIMAQKLYAYKNEGSTKAFSDRIYEISQKEDETPNVPSRPSGGGGGGGGGAVIKPVTQDVKTLEEKKDEAVTADKVSDKFSDLSSVKWAEDAINVLSDKNIINGRGNGIFAPNDKVLREELVKMAVLLFDAYDENAECGFSDVNKSDWFAPYVASAIRLGAVNGISETLFGSGESITREQLFAIVYRFAAKCGIDFSADSVYIPFDDDGDVSEYAKEAVSKLASFGIISGDENNFVNPGASCTRAEAAKILYNIYIMSLKSAK